MKITETNLKRVLIVTNDYNEKEKAEKIIREKYGFSGRIGWVYQAFFDGLCTKKISLDEYSTIVDIPLDY